jgi:hypothetical protein
MPRVADITSLAIGPSHVGNIVPGANINRTVYSGLFPVLVMGDIFVAVDPLCPTELAIPSPVSLVFVGGIPIITEFDLTTCQSIVTALVTTVFSY